MKVLKRDKTVEDFKLSKIEKAIKSAFDSCGVTPNDDILDCIKKIYNESKDETIGVEDIQDNVERCLMASYPDVAKAYIIYRYQHKLIRENQSKLTKQIKKKLTAEDVQNQNANVDEFSFGGRVGEASRVVTKQYALDYCMSRKARNNHMNNEIYIHDLDSYAIGMHNCLTIPFDELLSKGFKTRQTDIRPANSINTAFQLIAVLFQIQSLQQFGGVAAGHIDWTIVPYVRKSFYKHFTKKYAISEMKKEGKYITDSKELSEYRKTKRKEFNEKYDIKDEKFTIGDFSMDCVNFHIGDEKIININKDWYEEAYIETMEELMQAIEGMYHNLNSLQSRSGNQLPFTSINYGTCTLPEGRMVIKALLEGSMKGVGEHHLTPIFPCGIFQCMKGVNRKEGEPNYDLFKIALKSTSQRIYPNYCNVDWSNNKGYDVNNPRTYNATMGCHAKDTPIIMADGTRKMVQDVKVGDKIMGVNGQVRTVESLIRGNDKLFKVNQSRAESYIVNEGHILSLKYTSSKPYKGLNKGDVINISLHDFMDLPESTRRFMKGYKSSYELNERTFKIPPYILGLWLGDGVSSEARFSVNKYESKIIDDLYDYAKSIGRKLKIDEDSENCYIVTISDIEKQHELNPFRTALKELNLIKNKHIPEEYFLGSKEQRSALLAGLLNTDGWSRNGRGRKTVCFGNTNLNLINGAKRLADSLGYNTNIILAHDASIGKGICEGCKLKPYYHLSIHSFDDDLLMEHKRSVNSTSTRDFDTSTISVEEYGNGDFYGFELDGNRLYIINDGTVTHNCRTYNGYDINGFGQLKDGRGNLAPVTIIMPTLAMEVKQSFGEKEYTKEEFVAKFLKLLDKKIFESKDMLLERFERMCKQSPKAATFMWENGSMFGYNEKEGPISALRHGTLVIGQLGLAETLQILIDTDHTTEEGMALAKEIEGLFKKRCSEFKDETHLNFGVYYTPAENLCYTSFKKFKEQYGDIEGVTYFLKKDDKGNEVRKDKEYFTNSIHVPVYKEMSPFDKIDIESQLTSFSNAGCITYVELPSGTNNNIEGLETIVNYAMDKDIPYFAINVPIDECHDCGFTGEIGEVCPECGSRNVEHLRRVTGYLSTTYEHFNLGKQDETKDRVKHINNM